MVVLRHIFLNVLLLALGISSESQAASIRPALTTGLMVPPASQYYYYVYGAQVDLARDMDRALARLQYMERPAFNSAGYVDQDFSAMALLGSSVYGRGSLGATALVGGGYAWGFIKSKTDPSERNSYRLPGLAVGLEGRWSTKRIDLRIAHQVFIAQNSNDQLKAYVVWPFNWFMISIAHPFAIRG